MATVLAKPAGWLRMRFGSGWRPPDCVSNSDTTHSVIGEAPQHTSI
jgi:hypothetical protein